jgi:hypothetical protein
MDRQTARQGQPHMPSLFTHRAKECIIILKNTGRTSKKRVIPHYKNQLIVYENDHCLEREPHEKQNY